METVNVFVEADGDPLTGPNSQAAEGTPDAANDQERAEAETQQTQTMLETVAALGLASALSEPTDNEASFDPAQFESLSTPAVGDGAATNDADVSFDIAAEFVVSPFADGELNFPDADVSMVQSEFVAPADGEYQFAQNMADNSARSSHESENSNASSDMPDHPSMFEDMAVFAEGFDGGDAILAEFFGTAVDDVLEGLSNAANAEASDTAPATDGATAVDSSAANAGHVSSPMHMADGLDETQLLVIANLIGL